MGLARRGTKKMTPKPVVERASDDEEERSRCIPSRLRRRYKRLWRSIPARLVLRRLRKMSALPDPERSAEELADLRLAGLLVALEKSLAEARKLKQAEPFDYEEAAEYMRREAFMRREFQKESDAWERATPIELVLARLRNEIDAG
ncbi:MAG: hypothetical protein M3083_08230 [Actinomycetota bacterium]|nr:hypothetical protein [Actinomycetota bacterium]